MNREKTMIDKIKNSNFSFTKKFLYFMILPAIILVVGIVLLSTVGFNLGVDYAGGTTFKVYTNYEKQITNSEAKNYNLDVKQDYDTVSAKISTVLNNNQLKVVSIKKSTMTISEYHVFNGQAVEVVYQGNADTAIVANQLISEFGYGSFDETVSSFDKVTPVYSFGYVVDIVCALVFALIVALVYMALRYNPSVLFVGLIAAACDLFVTLGLIAITRVTINLTLGIVIFATFVLSMFNLMQYYIKWKEWNKQGKFEKLKPFAVADSITRELTFNRIVIYSCLLVAALLLVIFAVPGVRQVAIGLIIALIVSLYNAEFILPTVWATFTSICKKKNKHLNQQRNMSE